MEATWNSRERVSEEQVRAEGEIEVTVFEG
jgi:hypothetical protein